MVRLDSNQIEVSQTFQRSARRRKEGKVRESVEEVPKMKIGMLLFWSVLSSVMSVANPYLTFLASNIQTQNLYAGMAMGSGQHPYSDFFGTSGLVYYLLSYLGSFGNSWLLFGAFQFLALLLAGGVFYKLVAYLSRKQKVSTNLTHWFYLFMLGLGFGGLYAELFALPFVLMGLFFLVRYLDHSAKDEGFILYGIAASFAFLIDVRTIVLWLVAGIFLLFFNLANRRFARLVYQFLATLFGVLLVVYVIGYYAFETEILGAALQQAVLYRLDLSFQSDKLFMLLAFVLFSGFAKNVLQTLFSLGNRQHTYIKLLLISVFSAQLALLIVSGYEYWHQALLLLPYGLMLAVFCVKKDGDTITYLSLHWFLPVTIFFNLLLQPIRGMYIEQDVIRDRQEVAAHIQEKSASEDRIYVWDNSAAVYLESQRLAVAKIIATEPYLRTKSQQDSLLYDLAQHEAKFIAVNKNIPLLEDMKSLLDSKYRSVEKFGHFVLYQKAE